MIIHVCAIPTTRFLISRHVAQNYGISQQDTSLVFHRFVLTAYHSSKLVGKLFKELNKILRISPSHNLKYAPDL